MNHLYPKDLASFIFKNWDKQQNEISHSDLFDKIELPALESVENILSTCYQSSLLRHEGTALTFRVIIAEPDIFPPEGGPPNGLHKLEFTEYLPFSDHEIRKLSSAASFPRALIGVRIDSEQGPEIWGIIQTGPRWLHSLHGGRASAPPLPNALVISVTNPGHLEVSKGNYTLGLLSEGKVFGSSLNVFQSKWLEENFEEIRQERLDIHEEAKRQAKMPWANLNPDLTREIDQHMMKRIIAAVHAFNHGGTLIMVPPEKAGLLCQENPFISIKYQFTENEPRARFRSLIIQVMNSLAQSGMNNNNENRLVGWHDYQTSHDPLITNLDEAIFEMSHLIAALSTCDGAVVMTKRFELLGFGAEIHCDSSEVMSVARALDVEAKKIRIESVKAVGTRHRSAYRLCRELPDALVIVISQDGSVQFVKFNGKYVTCFDHQAFFSIQSMF